MSIGKLCRSEIRAQFTGPGRPGWGAHICIMDLTTHVARMGVEGFGVSYPTRSTESVAIAVVLDGEDLPGLTGGSSG